LLIYPSSLGFSPIIPAIADQSYYSDRLLGYLPLPSESWWTHYYTPAEKKLKEMRDKYRGNTDAQAIFNSFQLEIDMHRKYSDYYGYSFYIMRKEGK